MISPEYYYSPISGNYLEISRKSLHFYIIPTSYFVILLVTKQIIVWFEPVDSKLDNYLQV